MHESPLLLANHDLDFGRFRFDPAPATFFECFGAFSLVLRVFVRLLGSISSVLGSWEFYTIYRAPYDQGALENLCNVIMKIKARTSSAFADYVA